MNFFENDNNFYEKKVEKILSYQDIDDINEFNSDFETSFNNKMSFAIYQEYLTCNFLLQQIAQELIDKCQEGYILNLQFTEFIENVILLFNRSNHEIMPILYNELPAFLKIIVYYHNLEEAKTDPWIMLLTKELSIKDIMNAFNIEASESSNLKIDQARIEPYCILLDAALQEFSFEKGENKNKNNNIFTTFCQAHAIINNIKQFNINYEDKFKKLSLFYPVKTRYLIDMISKINLTYFLNGVVILSQKVTQKPSEKFLQKLMNTIFTENAYTICGTHQHNLIPFATPFYLIKSSLFYKPFKLKKLNSEI
jgi:hypothetical protein